MKHHIFLSLDFDGCLDSDEAVDIFAEKILSLAKRNSQFSSLICMIGSLRQSLAQDIYNGEDNAPNHGGKIYSCTFILDQLYPKLLSKLKNNFNLEQFALDFEKFLLGDIYDQFPTGWTFERMHTYAHEKDKDRVNIYRKNELGKTICLRPDKNIFSEQTSNSNVLTDCTKISILYAQMQFSANECPPDDTFNFIFVDDRKNILNLLANTFKSHPQLIPKNCQLQFIEYICNGYINFNYPNVAGTGELNKDWKSTLLSVRDDFLRENPQGAFIYEYERSKIYYLVNELCKKHPIKKPAVEISKQINPTSNNSFFKQAANTILEELIENINLSQVR